jgi:cation diffusion facilitator CzcD-associated flavoprotein CzcO
VAVIGAGASGLAVLKALSEHDVLADCFERGSEVGGLWRYENDNGLSAAYASLHTNVSRERMEYPSFPMPSSFAEFPHHTDVAAYLSTYADAFGLRGRISFRVGVERLERDPEGVWRVWLDDGSVRRYPVVVVAVGHDWCPNLPDYQGSFAGQTSHSRDYRTPEPFAGNRVLVVGAGQSAAEIAVEVAGVAKSTCISIRHGVHVIPRWIRGRPYDKHDVEPRNQMPWRLMNRLYGRDVARQRGPLPPAWPTPDHRILEGIPILSSDLLPAVASGKVTVKPAIKRLDGDRVRFADGTDEPFDHIIYATGYRISLPFLSPTLLRPRGHELALYRRIVPPTLPGLLFAGFTDAPGGLPPVAETQAEWIATKITGHLPLPASEQMWQAIDRAEGRTRQRFPHENPDSIRCDPHAYRRLLHSDLRQANRRDTRSSSSSNTLGRRLALPRRCHVDGSRTATLPAQNP